MVYVDELSIWVGDKSPSCFRNKPSCHMYADSLDELHDMAVKIGLQKYWFQDKKHLPHYDLTPSKRKLAIINGDIETDWEHLADFVDTIRMNNRQAEV